MGNSEVQSCVAHKNGCFVLSQDVGLRKHSTMRVGGSAKFFTDFHSTAELQCIYRWATARSLPVCTIGGGSNIIWTDVGFPGLVLRNRVLGFRIVSKYEDEVELHVGAGEILDEVVERSIQMGLTGVECLSYIPGMCGGAVIQNSGAYGQEISQVLQYVNVYDTHSHQVGMLSKDDCDLTYRSSIFKNKQPGRYVILGLTIKLQRGPPASPSYPALLAEMGTCQSFTSTEIRSAVIRVRKRKLPDPAVVPNCGSFFTNPVVSEEGVLATLEEQQAPLHAVGAGKYKVPAAWLIERCGLKNHINDDLGFGTWVGQPLVIFAMRVSSCDKLLEYSAMIESAVKTRFGVTLEREPVVMGI